MESKEFEGKDLAEALQEASNRLGIAEPKLDYEIVEPGRRGLFGLGAKSVRIRIMPPIEPIDPERPASGRAAPATADDRRTPREPCPRRREAGRRRGNRNGARGAAAAPRVVSDEPLDSKHEAVRETVQRMIDLLGLELSARGVASGDDLYLELTGPDQKMLTRKDSELLSAFQFLLNRMARRAWADVGRIRVGCDGRPRERDEELAELIEEVAQQVRHTGNAKRLRPMNAYERRMVHITVRKLEGVASRSEGNGNMKRVKIYKA